MLSFGVTDVGRRRAANQDSFIIDRRSASTLLAVVCDGMGGAAGGLEASSIACSVFADSVEADLLRLDERGRDVTPALCERILRRSVEFANSAVARRADEDPGLAGMGTTLVAALVSGERIYVANVGDSRLYSIKDGVATQVTHDHSYVQLLVDMGRLSPEEARQSKNKNIITRAVGTADEIECDVFTIDTLPDAILLCSDGLSNMLTVEEIGERFAPGLETEDDLTAVCRSLVDAANEKGGPDNITAVAVAFGVAEEEDEDDELLPVDHDALTDRIDDFAGDVEDDEPLPDEGGAPDGGETSGSADGETSGDIDELIERIKGFGDESADADDGADADKTDTNDGAKESEPAEAGGGAEPDANATEPSPAEDVSPPGDADASPGDGEAGGGEPHGGADDGSGADAVDDPDVPLGEDPEPEPEPRRHDRKKKATGQLRLPGMGFITGRRKDKKK